MQSTRILIAAPAAEAAVTAAMLKPLGFVTETAASGHQCLSRLRGGAEVGVVLITAEMAGGEQLECLGQLRSASTAPVIILVGAGTSARFVLRASQAGARGFLSTPVQTDELLQLLSTLGPAGALRQPADLPVSDPALSHPGLYMEDLGAGQFFLAGSPAMLDIVRQVKMLSRVDVPVLITGESGVGKEIVAGLLHKHSLRGNRPILKVNCAALPAELLESELFGYEAGAFTGAIKSKPGKFEQCDKGTILLDEIGEMSPQLQAKLLHVLQDGTFSRLGGRVNTKVDVRVIAATNVDIEQAILDKRFREDLYYRLNAFVLRVPPLRERRQEIPYLLRELTATLAAQHRLEPVTLPPRLIAAALEYRWPGNLRELGNFVKRYLIMRDETSALVELESKLCMRSPAAPAERLPERTYDRGVSAAAAGPAASISDQAEVRVIQEVLNAANWNRRIAAEKLQISYKSLLQKIRHYDLAASV